jgi:hypothetical protein
MSLTSALPPKKAGTGRDELVSTRLVTNPQRFGDMSGQFSPVDASDRATVRLGRTLRPANDSGESGFSRIQGFGGSGIAP